jgi:molybdate transport system ATP-binding protein
MPGYRYVFWQCLPARARPAFRRVVESIAADAHPSQALVRMVCGGSVLLAPVTARAVDALQLVPSMLVWAQIKAVALVE